MKAILRVEFPDSCEDCYFCRKTDGNYWCYVLERYVDYNDWGNWEERRHPNCPLIVEADNESGV